MNKIWINVRNLTTDTDMGFFGLPMSEKQLESFSKDCEYMILDSSINVDEYANIWELNELIGNWIEDGISVEEITIINKVTAYREMINTLNERNYCILNLDETVKGWAVYGDEAKGLALHEEGLYLLPFEERYDESMVDWIDWEQLWTDANCEGWDSVTLLGIEYLVRV